MCSVLSCTTHSFYSRSKPLAGSHCICMSVRTPVRGPTKDCHTISLTVQHPHTIDQGTVVAMYSKHDTSAWISTTVSLALRQLVPVDPQDSPTLSHIFRRSRTNLFHSHAFNSSQHTVIVSGTRTVIQIAIGHLHSLAHCQSFVSKLSNTFQMKSIVDTVVENYFKL